jgi:hypothetical protein
MHPIFAEEFAIGMSLFNGLPWSRALLKGQ